MITPAKPHYEQERLQALYACKILDTPKEPEFDNIVKLAAQITDSKYAVIALVDGENNWFKASYGFGSTSAARGTSFCGHAVLTPDSHLLVTDARRDVRFHNNPYVIGEPYLRFYAGFPLVTSTGYAIGTLCVSDSQPKDLTEQQEFALKTLAQQVMSSIELRQKVLSLQEANKIIHDQSNILERHNQSRVKLISMMSHDVRNALHALKSVLNLFHSEDLGLNETLNLMEMAEGNIDTTNELLENLLRWSSSQLDSRELNLQPVSLGYLVNESFISMQTKYIFKNNQFENLIPRDLLIKADKEIIRFMLRNLLANANKFTENGHIKVKLKESADRYHISVIDTGMGMNQEQMLKLFNTKLRASTKGTTGETGNGIGLQLCKELIERHKGEITVKSTPAVGTTFTFTIPKNFYQEASLLNTAKVEMARQREA